MQSAVGTYPNAGTLLSDRTVGFVEEGGISTVTSTTAENPTLQPPVAYTARVTATYEKIRSDPAMASSRSNRLPRPLQRVAFWSVIVAIAVFALVAGLIIRRYAWDQTEPIRFVFDINNAFRRGTQALQEGYLNLYDNQLQIHDDGEYDIDYAPGRLAIATLWTKHVREKLDGPTADWRTISPWRQTFYARAAFEGRQYELVRPLLMVNTVGEIASAIAIFFLVRRWTSLRTPIPRGNESRSAILGLVAALFFWFNLALIWNAHAWPQWDSWVLPFLLWALFAASVECWYTAGVLIAVGAMFKGQILFGAPMLILWPLWRGKLTAIVRWTIGAASGAAACTASWLLRPNQQFSNEAITWIVAMAGAFVMLIVALRWNWKLYVTLPLAALAVAVALWPMPQLGPRWLLTIAGAIAVTGAVAIWAPWRAIPVAASGWIATALLLCIVLFNGSVGWFHIGIAYGTHRYLQMTRGPANNLAGILQSWPSPWHDPMETALTLEPGRTTTWIGSALSSIDPRISYLPGQAFGVPLKYLLLSIYSAAVVLCSIGAAVHSKRGSPRFLAAVVTPWIVFFAVLPQMHERYLLWGAALTAVTVVINPGFALLHLLITIIAWSHEAQAMMMRHAGELRPWIREDVLNVFTGWNPGIGWALLLTAAIYLYISIAPERRQNRQPRMARMDTNEGRAPGGI